MIYLLLGWPCWILTNYKSSPKCPAGQLSQISSVMSWEPKTIKKPCTFHDFRVHYIWVSGGNWTMSLLEHWRNEEILKEATVQPIVMVTRRRRLEWFGHFKRRDETENIRPVVEMNREGECPTGRPKLRRKNTVRRDLKAWNIRGEWTIDSERWKWLCKTSYPAQGDGGER